MKNLVVKQDTRLQEVMDCILSNKLRTVFVENDSQRLIGCITEGDILRSVIIGAYNHSSASTLMNTSFYFREEPLNDLELIAWFLQTGSLVLPVLDSTKAVVKFQFPLEAIQRLLLSQSY